MAVIQYLQGVRDVTRALNIAKHNGYDNIIGTLLKHISNKKSLHSKSCELLVCLCVSMEHIHQLFMYLISICS